MLIFYDTSIIKVKANIAKIIVMFEQKYFN